MKIFAVVIICILSAVSGFAQKQTPLNEKLSGMFKQNFPEWQAANGDEVFYPMIKHTWKFNPQIHKAVDVTDLQSVWTKEKKRIQIWLDLADAQQREFFLRMFAIRNITPPSYEIDDLGDQGILMKFHDRVEIAFTKENVTTRINYDFPSKYKKPVMISSPKWLNAPKAEVEFALKVARAIADEIRDEQTIETLTGVRQ
jgi:hypothetical protein